MIFCHVVLAQPPQGNVMVIAHRGASAYAPENTLAAFRKAVELRADAIEIDVRQTSDSQLVVIHDASIKRTTNGTGDVEELTLRQLKAFDAGSWFDEQFREEKIPTLEETISILDTSTILIIEIKESSGTYPGIEKRVVDVIKKNRLEKRVILKSFEKEVLLYLRELAPEIPLLYVYVFKVPFLNLTIDHWLSSINVMEFDVEYLQPHRVFLTKGFVEEAHKNGKKVIAWGVDTEEDMKEAIEMGVDGIETDYPDVVRRMLGKN